MRIGQSAAIRQAPRAAAKSPDGSLQRPGSLRYAASVAVALIITITITIIIMLSLGMWGCRRAERPALDGPAAPLVWPAPPNRGRIRFVGTLPSRPAPQSSWWTRALALLAGIESRGSSDAGMVRPYDVAVTQDAAWVADPGAATLWRIDLRDGVAHRAGCAAGTTDAIGLVSPVGLALGPDNTVYIADSALGAVVVMDSQGRCVARWGEGLLSRPTSAVWLPDTHVLAVADAGNHSVMVFGADGTWLRTFGSRGAGDVQFNFPTHLTAGREGDLLVVDALNSRVQTLRSDDGSSVGVFGRAGDMPGTFNRPKGVAVDSDDHVYVVDALQEQVFIFSRLGEFLLAFGKTSQGEGLSLPAGIAIDPYDRIYVADTLNRRVQVFQYLRASISLPQPAQQEGNCDGC